MEGTILIDVSKLSADLVPIYEYEIGIGNCVKRVDYPAGTRCPLAVVFEKRLDIKGYLAKHGLPDQVEIWENRDSHYSIEKGYFSETSNHAISGPL